MKWKSTKGVKFDHNRVYIVKGREGDIYTASGAHVREYPRYIDPAEIEPPEPELELPDGSVVESDFILDTSLHLLTVVTKELKLLINRFEVEYHEKLNAFKEEMYGELDKIYDDIGR